MNVTHCFRCKKKPHEIDDYIQSAKYTGMTPEQYVREEEGTLNEEGRFCCDECYLALGMPSNPQGWRAP